MKRILIIEDEDRARANLVTILEMENYQVFEASHGAAGVALALQEQPDLILCDVNMPEMDGYEVLHALRENSMTAHIPFIFLTARSEKHDLRKGMNLGADDYLTKPVTVSELLTAMTARLHRESQRPPVEFKPNFSSAAPLEKLGLTAREAEVLLWVAQGKSNQEIATILGTAETTVKKHLQNIFTKLGVESRNAAAVRALETLH